MTRLRELASRALTGDMAMLVRSRLSGRRGLLILAVMTGLAGIALNWSWLAAAGIAPVLIAVLPCLVMCGLGLCMNRTMGGSCDSGQTAMSTPQPEFTDSEKPQGSPATENLRQRTSTPVIKIKTHG